MSVGDSATPLGKVRGLGSAREGGEHWLGERVRARALLLLGVWLAASLLLLPALDHRTLVEWLRAAARARCRWRLFIIVAFNHALDGMKVVVDDYVHDDGQSLRAEPGASVPRRRRRGAGPVRARPRSRSEPQA